MTDTSPEPYTPLLPSVIEECAALAVATLMPLVAADWSLLARGSEWTCQQALEHISGTVLFFAEDIDPTAPAQLPQQLQRDFATLSVPELLAALTHSAAILRRTLDALPPDARIAHVASMADIEGYTALTCEEILVHTWDITEVLGVTFHPPDALSRRIVARIFPWGPQGEQVDAWNALRWCAGRIALPGNPQLDGNWWRSSALLPADDPSRWDGRPNRPQWHV